MLRYGTVFDPIIAIIWFVIVFVVAAAVIRWLQSGTVGVFGREGARWRFWKNASPRTRSDKNEFEGKKRLLSA